MTSGFQRQFANRGDYDLALGSVYGIRYWRLQPSGYLHGQFGPWHADINAAICRKPQTTVQSAAFRAWAQGAGPAVLPDSIGASRAEPVWDPPHDAPDERCECGFYAYWREDDCPLGGQTPVMGVVEGFGRTLVGDKGFRCAKARIVALHIPSEDTDALVAEAEEVRSQLGLLIDRTDQDMSKKDMSLAEALIDRLETLRHQISRAAQLHSVDLSLTAEVETVLSDRYAVPVYASKRLMLVRHPLTTEYAG